MKNIITKTAAPLSFAVLLVIGSVSMESQANENNDLFLSNDYGVTLAFNSGVRGKPPYNRSNMNRQRTQNKRWNQNLQSVEMSALEVSQDLSTSLPATSTGKAVRSVKKYRGGHPDRSKRLGTYYY